MEGRTRVGDGPREPEVAAVTLSPASGGDGGARARQEAPPSQAEGAGLAGGATVGPGAEPVVRGVSATPPRRRRRMSQRLPGEQQAAPPGQVGAGLGSARLPSAEGHGAGQAPRHRDVTGGAAGGPLGRARWRRSERASGAEVAAPA